MLVVTVKNHCLGPPNSLALQLGDSGVVCTGSSGVVRIHSLFRMALDVALAPSNGFMSRALVIS